MFKNDINQSENSCKPDFFNCSINIMAPVEVPWKIRSLYRGGHSSFGWEGSLYRGSHSSFGWEGSHYRGGHSSFGWEGSHYRGGHSSSFYNSNIYKLQNVYLCGDKWLFEWVQLRLRPSDCSFLTLKIYITFVSTDLFAIMWSPNFVSFALSLTVAELCTNFFFGKKNSKNFNFHLFF